MTRTFARYGTAGQTDGDTSMAGAGDEGGRRVAAHAIALRTWILLTPAMFSGTGLAAFALARTAGRTQLEATVMGRAKLRTVHALAMLAARLMPGVPAASLHYVAAVARVGVPAFAAAMARRLGGDGLHTAVPGHGIGWGHSPRC